MVIFQLNLNIGKWANLSQLEGKIFVNDHELHVVIASYIAKTDSRKK